MLVVALLAGVFVSAVFIVSSIKIRKRKSDFVEVGNKLKYIYSGIQWYNYFEKRLPPPDGKCSWRLRIVEDATGLGTGARHNEPIPDFSQNWNSIHNQSVGTWVEIFSYANSPKKVFALGVIGPDSAFSKHGKKLNELPDDLIIVIEGSTKSFDWRKPSDLDVTHLSQQSLDENISKRFSFGFHVLFADGTVWALVHDIPTSHISPFLTINGSKQNQRDDLLGAYRSFP